MGLAGISPAQKADAFAWQVHDDDVLIGVRLLLPTVVEGLFCRVFRPLSPPFGAIDDQPGLDSWRALAAGEVLGVPLREHTQTVQSIPQDGQQPVNPVV